MIQKGSKVKIDYEGRLETGEVFDSSHKHEGHEHLLEFEVGSGQVIPGFEKAVLGMKKGEEKEVKITPDEAYGMHDARLIHEVPREMIPKHQVPQVGMMMIIGTPDGQKIPAIIKKVDDKKVTIDINHPLAGKTLIFKIKVVDC